MRALAMQFIAQQGLIVQSLMKQVLLFDKECTNTQILTTGEYGLSLQLYSSPLPIVSYPGLQNLTTKVTSGSATTMDCQMVSFQAEGFESVGA